MRLALAVILFSLSLCANGASWYLDSAASGSNNGTSWANAWKSPTNVVWGGSGVTAGDTLYVSGGTTSKTYSEILVFAASGTSGNPITLKVGQDAGHNGQAVFPAINVNTRTWTVIDGARSASFVPYTNPNVLGTNAANMGSLNQTNMGILVSRTNGLGMYYEGAGGANNTIRWVEIANIGTTNDIGTCHGISLNNLTTLTNFVIDYCYIHHIQNDGINHNSTATAPLNWDAIKIRWTAIQYVGDDGIQATCNGWTIQNCDIRWHYLPLYNGHPDKIQFSGQASKYLKVVNSVMGQSGNSIIIGEHLISDNDFIGPMLIAGNIFANTRESETNWYVIQAYGATFNAWRANDAVSATNGYWTNLYVFNNTVYWQRNTPFQFGRALPDGDTRSVWDLRINGAMRNNLILDSKYNSPGTYSAFSIHGDGDYSGGTNGVYYSTNELPVTHNIVAGNNTTMTYHGVQGTNANVHGMGNTSSRPLIETNSYSFVLDATDTVAKDQGYSLSALTNQFPELMFDMAGNPRGVGGWDIGAMETVGVITNGLVLRVNFDDTPADADDGYDDTSGYGHHALHFGYGNAHATSNRVPTQITWTNTISSLVHTGANFVRYQDGWDEYNASGSYLGVTNRTTGKLWVMPVATIMFFGRYNAHTTNEAGYTNWNAGANRTFLSGGYGYAGAWSIQLDGAQWTQLTIYTNNNASANTSIRWDDRINTGTPGQIGNSSNMVHYALTWSNGLAVTYMNGVPFRTNQFLDGSIGGGAYLTNLTVRGPAGLATGMLQIGGDSHNGNPWLVTPAGVGDDGDGTFYEVTGAKQVPNHGWLGPGTMDDVRIYERVLNTSEIYQIASNTETGGGASSGGGSGGGGGGSSTSAGPTLRISNSTPVTGSVRANQISGP